MDWLVIVRVPGWFDGGDGCAHHNHAVGGHWRCLRKRTNFLELFALPRSTGCAAQVLLKK